jgi:hypothetical protein
MILAATQQPVTNIRASAGPKPASDSAAPQRDTYSSDPKSEEKIPFWAPFANAAIAAAVVGVPAALGAGGAQLIGPAANSEAAGLVVSAVGGVGAGCWAFKSSKKEFNGHPILVGMSTLGAGFGTALALPLLVAPGAAYGWTGAVVASGVVGAAAGVATAVAMIKQRHADSRA